MVCHGMRPSCSQPDFLCCASSVRMSSSSGCTSPACFHSRGTEHIFLGTYWSTGTDLRFPKSFLCKGAGHAPTLRASTEKGKQRGPNERKPGEKQGKRKDNVWSTDNDAARSGAGHAGSRKDNVWRRDDNARGSSGAKAVKGGKTGGKITPSRTGGPSTGSRAGSLGGENGVALSADIPSVKDPAKRDAEQDVGSRLQKLEDVIKGNGRYAENSGSSFARVRVSASLPTKIDAVLQPEELAASPLWKTFSSSVSGVWRGVGAAFSPITADMEAMSLGEDNEYLYDAHVLCIVESTEIKEQDGISPRLARKVFWKVDNPHGEQGLGEVVVQDVDLDELDLTESGELRGEAGEAFFLDELTPVGLIGTEEIQSVEQDMLPIPWEDGDQFLILSDLEGGDSTVVPDTEWESEINVAGEIVVDWEKGEGALTNLELPKELVADQITADWRSIMENDGKMEKPWDDVWDVTEVEELEDAAEAFGPEGVLSGNSSYEKSEAGWKASQQEHASPAPALAPASNEVTEDHSSEIVQDDWDDVMEEDLMGQEAGLIFFEDGSYSRGPLRLLAQATNSGDDQYALPPTFKVEHCLVSGGHRRLRLVHTISIEDGGEELQVLRVVAYEEEWLGPASMPSISGSGGHELVPFSRRPRLVPDQLTGSWKSFAKTASVGFPPRGQPTVVYSTKETSVTRELPHFVSLPEGEKEAAHIGDITDVGILWLPGGISAIVDIQEEGTLTIGASWLLADGTRIAIERDYDSEGNLAEVRTLSEVKGGWIGGRM